MKRFKYLLLMLVPIIMGACNVMQAIALKDCRYTYDRVTNVTFLGLPSDDLLSFTGIYRVGEALLGKSEEVPLGFTVHLKVDNPNKRIASVDKVFYTVHLDSIQVASGSTTEPLIVPGETQVDFPLRFVFDLKTMLKSGSYPTLAKLVKNFIGMGDESTQVTIGLKPVIRVGGVAVSMPKPVKLQFAYGGKKQKMQ